MTTDQPTDNQSNDEAAATPLTPEELEYRKELKILDHFGTVDFDPDYDYKSNRMRDKIQLD